MGYRLSLKAVEPTTATTYGRIRIEMRSRNHVTRMRVYMIVLATNKLIGVFLPIFAALVGSLIAIIAAKKKDDDNQ